MRIHTCPIAALTVLSLVWTTAGYAQTPASTLPPIAELQEAPQDPPPPQVYPQIFQPTPVRYGLRPKYGLIIGGAATLGGAYVVTAGFTALADGVGCLFQHGNCGLDWPLFIPIVGPFIHLATTDRNTALLAGPVLVLSGLAQLTGLTLLIVGAVARDKYPIYTEMARKVTVTPYLGLTGGGLQALVRY